jgi:hypothetical protein
MRKVLGLALILVLVVASQIYAQEAKKGIKLSAEVGLEGGAGVAGINALLPFSPRKDVGLKVKAGYGLGNNYNVMLVKGIGVFNLTEPMFIEGSLEYVNYSTKVTGILGRADAEKGGSFGVGVALGRDFGKLVGKVGYSTALGVVALAEYEF